MIADNAERAVLVEYLDDGFNDGSCIVLTKGEKGIVNYYAVEYVEDEDALYYSLTGFGSYVRLNMRLRIGLRCHNRINIWYDPESISLDPNDCLINPQIERFILPLRLAVAGYNRIECPFDPEDPFREMVEGGTEYCSVCRKSYCIGWSYSSEGDIEKLCDHLWCVDELGEWHGPGSI